MASPRLPRRHLLTFPVSVVLAVPAGEDSKAQLRSALHVPGLPVTLVFDRQGRLVLRQVGQVSVSTLRKAIQDASAT